MLVLDPSGKERRRLEGYLSKDDFQAFLTMGLARVAFSKKDWKTAEKFYGEVAAKSSAFTPEAVYWQGVSIYKDSGDHDILGKTAQALKERFAGDIWAEKSIPWLG